MEWRDRNRISRSVQGSIYEQFWDTERFITDGESIHAYDTCLDNVKKKARKSPPALAGMVEPSFCDISKMSLTSLAATGQSSFIFKGWPITPWIGWATDGDGTFLRRNDRGTLDERYALILLQKTNPGRPILSVPVFIKELVEVPLMFRLAAKSFAGLTGGAYLNYRFGWLTFMSDIRTLANITRDLERRVQEFVSLSKHGGLRRKVLLDTRAKAGVVKNQSLHSTWGLWVDGDIHWNAECKIWGSVRWVPTRNWESDLERLGIINLAFRKVFDLERPDAATIWEMIPWSWLVDYFVDISTYLRATQDSDLFVPYDICITWEHDYQDHGVVTNKPSGVTLSGTYSRKYHMKSRSVQYVTLPNYRTELFSTNQWLVIAALFAKFRG